MIRELSLPPWLGVYWSFFTSAVSCFVDSFDRYLISTYCVQNTVRTMLHLNYNIMTL